MPKEKINIVYRIGHWAREHPWLKLIALLLAFIVWLYVRSEVGIAAY